MIRSMTARNLSITSSLADTAKWTKWMIAFSEKHINFAVVNNVLTSKT